MGIPQRNNSMNYLELTLEVDQQFRAELDQVQSLVLDKFGCDGVLEMVLDEPEVDEILGERSFSGGNLPSELIDEVVRKVEESVLKRVFYFSGIDAEERVNKLLMLIKNDHRNITAVVSIKEEQDWHENWRKDYKPIWISKDLEIVPSWLQDSYSSKATRAVYIYPGQGFGTGDHSTTFLCLSQFEKYYQKQDHFRCLDFGCGSGILGIVALDKNRKATTDFYDIDPASLENTHENLKINFGNLSQYKYRILSPKDRRTLLPTYDLIFANILMDVLLHEKDFFIDSMAESGLLILSGILQEQEETILDSYLDERVELVETAKRKDWISIVLRKKEKL